MVRGVGVGVYVICYLSVMIRSESCMQIVAVVECEFSAEESLYAHNLSCAHVLHSSL